MKNNLSKLSDENLLKELQSAMDTYCGAMGNLNTKNGSNFFINPSINDVLHTKTGIATVLDFLENAYSKTPRDFKPFLEKSYFSAKESLTYVEKIKNEFESRGLCIGRQ